MFNSKVSYVTRASRQQEQRRQKKKAVETKFGLSSAELATV